MLRNWIRAAGANRPRGRRAEVPTEPPTPLEPGSPCSAATVRTRPAPGFFVPLAALLVVGATGFSITGYGGYKELGIALSVLALSVVLWLYRTKVQDRRTSAGEASSYLQSAYPG